MQCLVLRLTVSSCMTIMKECETYQYVRIKSNAFQLGFLSCGKIKKTDAGETEQFDRLKLSTARSPVSAVSKGRDPSGILHIQGKIQRNR